MANVIVKNSDGSKSIKSAKELVEMAKTGQITVDTELEFNGRKVSASKIRELQPYFAVKESNESEKNDVSAIPVKEASVADIYETTPIPGIEQSRIDVGDVVPVPPIDSQSFNESANVYNVTHAPVQNLDTRGVSRSSGINVLAIVALVIGLVTIAVGVATVLHKPVQPLDFEGTEQFFKLDLKDFPVTDYDLPKATFGADFYTETHRGLDVIVDVLAEINARNERAVTTIAQSTQAITKSTAQSTQAITKSNAQSTLVITTTIYTVGGLIIVAMGLTLTGGSLIFLKRR